MINKSQYRTRDLKKILTFALKCWWKRVEQERSLFNKTALQTLRVEVYNRKNGPCTASINGYNLSLNLWHQDLSEEENKKKLAWIIRHEIHHLNGMEHKSMRGSYYLHWPKEFIREDWILGFPLRLKEVRERVKIDIKELRYQKVVHLLEQWKKKARRAMRRVRLYQVKARRYEKVFAAAKRKEN